MPLHTVAIDWRPALFRAFGIGRYVRNMVAGIIEADSSIRLELLAVFMRGRAERIAKYPPVASPRVSVHGMALPARLWGSLASIGFSADRLLSRAQLFHYTDYFVTPCRKLPRVVTLYDAAWRADLGHVDSGQSRKMELAVRDLVATRPEVITISQAARDELIDFLSLQPDRVHVTPLAPDPLFSIPARAETLDQARLLHGLSVPYVIHLGTLEPRKNVRMLVRAHARAAAIRGGLGLVLLGRRGWRHHEVLDEISQSPARDSVRWLGDVSDEVCAALVQDAAALAFPTLHEGYGLPAIEGMAAGIPVVLSDLAVLHEVGGSHAVYCDPHDESRWVEALLTAVDDPRARILAQSFGRAFAAASTWRLCGERTMAAYRSCVGRF